MPANPRQSCIRALLEWEKGKYFSDEILHTSLEKQPLPPLDRAFFMETFFGVLRNLSRLDFLIGHGGSLVNRKGFLELDQSFGKLTLPAKPQSLIDVHLGSLKAGLLNGHLIDDFGRVFGEGLFDVAPTKFSASGGMVNVVHVSGT